MGIETVRRATDSFERKQRRCLDLVEAPNLFTGAPRVAVAVVASPLNGHAFVTGESYRLRRQGNAILIVHGITAVGHVDSPPPSVLETMRGACLSAVGRVAALFTLSGKAELLLE